MMKPARGENPSEKTESVVSYVSVFDVVDQPYPWWFPSIGLGSALAFAALFVVVRRQATKQPGFRLRVVKWLFAVGAVLGLVWAIGVLAATRSLFVRSWSVHQAGKDEVVEGIVEAVDQLGVADRVVIDGKAFVVNGATIGPGYTTTSRAGGVLRKGAQVRIHYLEGFVLQVEVQSRK